MHKLLIVEDIEALRVFVAALARETLHADLEIIEAVDAASALQAYRLHQPDAIILDIVMNETSGLKIAQEIWRQDPQAKVLFWSQVHREAYLRELARFVPLEAVHGYTLKNESADKLKHAMLSVFVHNNPYVDPKVRTDKSKFRTRDNSLSDVEYETLVDVMLGLTDRAIATRRSISVRGVQNRLASLLTKLMQKEHWALQRTAGMEIYNPRTRVIYEALKRGFISIDELLHFEEDLGDWLRTDMNYVRPADALMHGNSTAMPVSMKPPVTSGF